jgi:hypothetical protein
LRDFRAYLYRDLTEEERDRLGLLIDVKEEAKRPFAFATFQDVRYEITLIIPPPNLRKYGVKLWKVIVIRGRKKQVDYTGDGYLRAKLRELFSHFSPAAAELLNRVE